ncbi:hypothetical protein DC363_07085 [Thalassorhabdomicrobium marinisediminis]|uniref:Uncharacterized protein n=1 Tax=Thalassorhabdomicrobium marinisediminis TaxID=2170577 RepID=A0A2T7FXQ4_9RHOB|nr:hypothetical protein DC363_07085 [Thalassorhabdomicrobium marinisediminis]
MLGFGLAQHLGLLLRGAIRGRRRFGPAGVVGRIGCAIRLRGRVDPVLRAAFIDDGIQPVLDLRRGLEHAIFELFEKRHCGLRCGFSYT